MEKEEFLSDPNISESLKAFAVTLVRLAIREPRILLALEQIDKSADHVGRWKSLYDKFANPASKDGLLHLLAQDVSGHDWTEVEQSHREWGKFGWITGCNFHPIDFWDVCPGTQVEADKKVLKTITKKVLSEIKTESLERTSNISVFEECCKCFDNKCYSACASLLISLIDGELIRSKANSLTNRKTGATAGKRIISDISADDMYGLPGMFHLEIINYEAFINMLFEHANGFDDEPKRMNRNFIQHGMSKRKVLRKDCIKLFLAYHKTLSFLWDKSTSR